MKKDKKFIIGLILTIIGVIGLPGIPSNNNKPSLFIGSLLFIVPGVILLYLVRKSQYPKGEKDIYGNVLDKKPLRKEWWVYLIAGCFIFGLFCNIGNSNKDEDLKIDTDVIAIQQIDTTTDTEINTTTDNIDTEIHANTSINDTGTTTEIEKDTDTSTESRVESEKKESSKIHSSKTTSSKAVSSKVTSSKTVPSETTSFENSSSIIESKPVVESVVPTPQVYIFTINTDTNCFHSTDCYPSTRISDENRSTYEVTANSLQEAIDFMTSQGYNYCGVCGR